MSVGRIHQIRPFPNFKLDDLPEAERDDAGTIRVNIGDMHGRATSFWAARMLFQNCAERKLFDPANSATYHQWQLCAARDAVMSIYHFGRLAEGIDISLGNCPKLRDIIDTEAKRATWQRYKKLFPAYISLRHAIAHSAERSNTVQRGRKHGAVKSRTLVINPEIGIKVSADTSILLLDDHIYGTTFSSMWDGNIVKCEISDKSGLFLDQITDSYWSVFDAIIDSNPEPPPIVTVSSQSQL